MRFANNEIDTAVTKLTGNKPVMDTDPVNKGLHRLYFLACSVAALVLGLIIYGFHTSNQVSRIYEPLVDASMEIELEATKAHLWFEEVLSGDSFEDLQEGWNHLRKADWYARVMVEGGENEQNIFIPLENGDLKDGVARIREKLERFRKTIKKRIESRESSRPGSVIDQELDVVYNEVIEETNAVEWQLKRMMQAEFIHEQMSQKVLLGICALLFTVLGVVYMRYNKQRTGMLRELQHAKAELENRVDERRKIEQEIQTQNEVVEKRLLEIVELRDMDEERLAELNLANEQLRIAIDEAELQERDKSEFFAGMTHEIRTPANAIIDLTYLALDTPLNNDQKDKINTIKESAYSVLSLLDSYMDILEIEYGNLEIKKTEFNIQNMLDSIIMTLSPQAHKKGVELLSHIDTNVIPHVIGDKGRLWQILIHLIGNAIKFTVDGKIELRVKRVYFGSGGDHSRTGSGCQQVLLQFSVIDTGIGIPEENLIGIFEHYSASSRPNIREFGETRLGLHVSNKLVHLMGGEIWAESQQGEGSAFHFTTIVDLADGPDKHAAEPIAEDRSKPSCGPDNSSSHPGESPIA